MLPSILQLFTKYQKDAMLAEDILELMKKFARLSDNETFKQLVLPHVFEVIKLFH